MDGIDKAYELYSYSKVISIKKIDTSHSENDKRYVFITYYEDKTEVAIKIVKNTFTTPERIMGWKTTCEHYNNIGIYCPKIVLNQNGNYYDFIVSNNESFIVYAEEINKHMFIDDFVISPKYEKYRDALIESIGIVASNSTISVPWVSAQCLYDVFDVEDECDENFENGTFIYNTIINDFPQYSNLMNEIWDIYLHKRIDFESIYRSLPKAVFQGDLTSSNIILNANGNFEGLIDFNLSGTEPILSYILCECGRPMTTNDCELLANHDFLAECDDYLNYNLALIKNKYQFTADEIYAYNLAYNTIFPFTYGRMSGMLRRTIQENKTQYIPNILSYLLYQLTRNDLQL